MSTGTQVIIKPMENQYKHFHMIGERLCLNFLNTANWSEAGEVVEEKLNNKADAFRWGRSASVGSGERPFTVGKLPELLKFRASLRHLFDTTVNASSPIKSLSKTDLEILNLAYGDLLTLSLRMQDGQIAYNPAVPLQQIVQVSALALLTAPNEISRVKMCGGQNCGWFFLDESKNRRRRWCTMELCGNREKARRHYKRKVTADKKEA